MMWVAIAAFLTICCVSYGISRNIFHPAFVVSGLWLALLSLYALCDHPLWPLSYKFYKALILWVVPFSVVSILIGQYKLRLRENIKILPNINVKLYNRLYPIVIAFSISLIIAVAYYAGGVSLVSIRRFMVAEQFPAIVSLLLYFNTFMVVYALYGLLNIEHLAKGKIVFMFVLLLIISVVKSNKTSFLALFISVLYILYRKKVLRIIYVVYAILILAGLLTLVTLNRGDFDFEADNAILTFVYIYVLSPLTAFDSFLNGEVALNSGSWGSGTFVFIYKLINAMGGDFELAQRGTWVNVPLPTNVFTVMLGYYLNNGYFGIFSGSVILGIIWGTLYRLQRKGYPLVVLFFATMISSLLFQSFGDYFFYSFSTTLQYYIFSLIMTRGVRLHRTCIG